MNIEHTKGWTEVLIEENCSNSVFYKIASILCTNIGIAFTNKIDGLDSVYWDFIYRGRTFTLHYNNFVGVSIYPKAMADAVTLDNIVITELAQTLSTYLVEFNNPNKFVAKYFDPEPIRWGLRGDPYLWRDMKQRTASTNIPATVGALEKLLHKLFKELVGETPQKGKFIHVKNYEALGMSSGVVCSDFWLDKGFALIIQRYIEQELR